MSDRPDDLRRQVATLWRAAWTGFDTMKEVVVRSSQAGKLRFDIAFLQRERAQLLNLIGERTCEYLDRGGGEVPDEIHRLHERIRDVESRIKTSSVKAYDNAFGAPRGFEPEAAADYGDDQNVEETPEAAPAVKSPPPARSRAATKRKRSTSKHKNDGA